MPSSKTLIRAGGVFNILAVLFHLGFWWFFGWEQELERMSAFNGEILVLLNLVLIVVFGFIAWVSLRFPEELVNTSLGRTILGFCVGLFAVRGVSGWIVPGIPTGVEIAVTAAILFALTAYGVPLSRRSEEEVTPTHAS